MVEDSDRLVLQRLAEVVDLLEVLVEVDVVLSVGDLLLLKLADVLDHRRAGDFLLGLLALLVVDQLELLPEL